MANPAPTINQINAFNATQGTTIDFNIIGGTELVRSNRIYIYDLSDNSLICTHLYVSTESIHELPANTDGSILYADGKSSADFVNGAQYYAQIQTFTDIAGTEGGSGLSVAKMFWCLVDPTLTIDAIPSTISTTSYNVSATYDANTSVVSNIIQQYQFNLYNATGSLLQSSGVIVGSGEQQGTSTAYDISYNFTGLSVGSSYYVTVEVTTTQGMSINTQSNTFTVSIDTPTLGEATVVNNACDGYISVTSNLSSEYGGSGSGEIVSFDTDSENVFTKLQVDLEPIQDLHGYDAPWVGGAGKNKFPPPTSSNTINGITVETTSDGEIWVHGTPISTSGYSSFNAGIVTQTLVGQTVTCFINEKIDGFGIVSGSGNGNLNLTMSDTATKKTSTYASGGTGQALINVRNDIGNINKKFKIQLELGNTQTSWTPYENICPISGHDEVDVEHTGVNLFDKSTSTTGEMWTTTGISSGIPNCIRSALIPAKANTNYYANWTGRASLWGVYFFDKDENYISRIFAGAESPQTITTPNNCAYIGINMPENQLDVASLNYPSTDHDYHAYVGTTYHQDIEATYTPTVQENEAYLFKQTGDVGGDRETIELVGGTVAWNQLIPNPTTIDVSLKAFVSGTQIFKDHIYLVSFMGKKTNESGATPILYWYQNDGQQQNPNSFRFGDRLSKPVRTTTSNGGYNGDNNTWFYVSDSSNLTFESLNVIDLTQMFGTTIADYIYSLEQANAGDGVAFFRKLFPKNYYPYTAGELISVKTSSHDTFGKNLWQPFSATSQGVSFDVNEDGTIHIHGTTTGSGWVQGIKNVPLADLGLSVGDTIYAYSNGNTSSEGKFISLIRFYNGSTYLNQQIAGEGSMAIPSGTDTLRLIMYGSGRTGTPTVGTVIDQIGYFEFGKGSTIPNEWTPYIKNTYPLDSDLELRGMLKLDISNKLYYDGDTYKHDGSVNRKYGIVDLGACSWGNTSVGGTSTSAWTTSSSITSLVKKPSANSVVANVISGSYTTKSANDNYLGANRSIAINTNGQIAIYDTSMTGYTGGQVATALNGVYLVYELAAPTTETADAFEEIQKVTPIYGTEEFADSRTVPMPVYTKTQYLTRDVYGGYIDFVNGLLVLDETKRFLGKYNTWNTWGVNANANGITGFYVYANTIETSYANLREITNCKTLPIKNTAWGGQAIGTFFNMGASTPSGWYYIVSVPNSIAGIADDDGDSIAITKWNAFLENNPIEIVQKLAEPLTFQLTPQQIQTFVGKNNVWSEQGQTSLAYHIPITNLLVKRQDVADVSGDWLTLYSQPITQASDMDFTFIDFTNQYGKTYKYALVPLLTQTQSGVEVEVEGGYTVSDEVQSVFDGVFIVDSTGSQKCKANVGYGNVDMNQTVGTITPIGAKYPVVITNSKNQYHNGSISGTIVPDDYYFNGNLSRIDMVNKRDELEQFLTNKRAKIIKDWNGKIWLVMIMDNVSCTFNNNYGMGIVNFSTNWVEVGDPTNQQDLQATGLIDVGGA